MRLRIKYKNEIFTHDVQADTVTIGRSSDNDFTIPVEDLSRKHCLITIKGGYAFIMDLNSKNGVKVDGNRIPPHQQFPIYENTRVTLANHLELITYDGSIKENGEVKLGITDLPKR